MTKGDGHVCVNAEKHMKPCTGGLVLRVDSLVTTHVAAYMQILTTSSISKYSPGKEVPPCYMRWNVKHAMCTPAVKCTDENPHWTRPRKQHNTMIHYDFALK